jgi:hypothetical protein
VAVLVHPALAKDFDDKRRRERRLSFHDPRGSSVPGGRSDPIGLCSVIARMAPIASDMRAVVFVTERAEKGDSSKLIFENGSFTSLSRSRKDGANQPLADGRKRASLACDSLVAAAPRRPFIANVSAVIPAPSRERGA